MTYATYTPYSSNQSQRNKRTEIIEAIHLRRLGWRERLCAAIAPALHKALEGCLIVGDSRTMSRKH